MRLERVRIASPVANTVRHHEMSKIHPSRFCPPKLQILHRGQIYRIIKHITSLFVIVRIISPSYLLDSNFERAIYVFEFFRAEKSR